MGYSLWVYLFGKYGQFMDNVQLPAGSVLWMKMPCTPN